MVINKKDFDNIIMNVLQKELDEKVYLLNSINIFDLKIIKYIIINIFNVKKKLKFNIFFLEF